LETVFQFRQASAKTLQSIADLQTDLHVCEQSADIRATQHGLTQLETGIETVNSVIENVHSANVTRTSFAPVDIRSAIKPELENILGLLDDVRGLLNPPQVNRMLQSNVIRFNEAAQELNAAAKNLVAGLRSKVMIRPGLGVDLPEFEDPPTPAPSPPPILHPSETPPMRSRLRQVVLIAGVILAICLSWLVVSSGAVTILTKLGLHGQHQADGTKGDEPAPDPNATNGTIQDTRQTDSKPIEPAPAPNGAAQQNSTRVLAPTSARALRKTTLPISAAHVRLVWSSNQAVTGNAYRTLGISSHEQCARRCRNDIRCEAMDYAKESETCRLFGSIERSDPSANSDYALKAQ
jgi:PAN domain